MQAHSKRIPVFIAINQSVLPVQLQTSVTRFTSSPQHVGLHACTNKKDAWNAHNRTRKLNSTRSSGCRRRLCSQQASCHVAAFWQQLCKGRPNKTLLSRLRSSCGRRIGRGHGGRCRDHATGTSPAGGAATAAALGDAAVAIDVVGAPTGSACAQSSGGPFSTMPMGQWSDPRTSGRW